MNMVASFTFLALRRVYKNYVNIMAENALTPCMDCLFDNNHVILRTNNANICNIYSISAACQVEYTIVFLWCVTQYKSIAKQLKIQILI